MTTPEQDQLTPPHGLTEDELLAIAALAEREPECDECPHDNGDGER